MRLATKGILIFAFAVALCAAPAAASVMTRDGIDDATREALSHALGKKLDELTDSRNEDGKRNKRAQPSRFFRKQDDGSYRASAHIETAAGYEMTTQRYEFVISPKGGSGEFGVTQSDMIDEVVGLHRTRGMGCYPFDRFRFDGEGLTLTGSKGGVCETYFEDGVTSFTVMADDLRYEYEIPEHVGTLQQNHDAYALKSIVFEDHPEVFDFKPERFSFRCDAQTCEELLESTFEGLTRAAPEARSTTFDASQASFYEPLQRRMAKSIRELEEDRRDNPFAHFRRGEEEGNRFYQASVFKDDDHSVGIYYDNWEGYEVVFFAFHRSTDFEAPRGALFGYYTEETLKNTSFYDLESRPDQGSRWVDVYKFTADVEAGIDDPEMISVEADFGLNIKQDVQLLPFFIATDPDSSNRDYRRATLFVNSIRMNGEELTWIKTGIFGGIVILPQRAKAGDRVEMSMSFDSKAIRKFTPSYSALARFGWMPFVRFGDFIEEFDLTIRTPAQYKVLGVGHQAEERREGDVLVTRWTADSPVVFPSVIFGKYFTDDAGDIEAKKLDGTIIPVHVHVDEVSMMQLTSEVNTGRDVSNLTEEINSGARGIRGKQLRTIAQQAANSINLYAAISGLDYPYGELNLVNDPALALYGQAPSSLIYLGSLVFRGEGEIAGDGGIFGGGGTSTAKFLKSVVAHEVGHQWWGSRVSNSNQRNYWFVETLAEYFSALYLEAVFGRKEYDEQVDEWRRNVLNNTLKTSVQAADTLWPGESGGRARQSLIYNKGPYAFHVLRETFGDEKFFPFLKGFTQELAAKQEIVTRDIQLAAEKHLGGVDQNGNPYNVDLEWFFDQWIRGVGIPEFTLTYSVRPTEDGGYLLEGEIQQVVVVGNKEPVEGKYYRGFVDLKAKGRKKNEEYIKRLTVDGPTTPFRVKLPVKPVEVSLNDRGSMLAHDVQVRER